jgi:GNAT superfamily N-acetyltransferase
VDFHIVEENLRESFRVLASSRPTGVVREAPGVSIASAGVTFQMFNAAFLSAPVNGERELERRIVTARAHFAERRQPWSYWVCEGWLDKKARRSVAAAFRKHGLHLATVLPGMMAATLTDPVRTLPQLDLRPVGDRKTWTHFCQIGALCFNVPLAWFQEVFDDDRVWESGFKGYVGYAGGEPVSTAGIVIASGAVGVYNVATVPGQQKRGFGEAVMRHALALAREQHGAKPSILQSTAQGFELYRRMGYSVVTDVAVYTS